MNYLWFRTFALLPLVLGSVLLAPQVAEALPRMTLTAGSRCSNCHVNPQGGGLRNDMGFYALAQSGMVTWDKVGWQKFHDLSDNQAMDGRLTYGFDYRGVVAKLGAPRWGSDGQVVEPSRIAIPMQFSPALAWKITDWLSATASMNPLWFYRSYSGQSPADGWLQIKPAPTLPSVRVGMIQPSFGIRHDDHTLLLRRHPKALGQPLMPPAYADPGAELNWEPLHWLSVDAAALWGRNLSLADKAIAKDQPVFSGRLTLWPQVLDWGLNSWVGASALVADGVSTFGGHAGLGKGSLGSLVGELVFSKSRGDRQILSTLVQLSHPVKDWLVLEARWEQSRSSEPGQSDGEATTYVAGVQWMPLPNLELRPEYRWLDTKDYLLAQYTLQFHLWL